MMFKTTLLRALRSADSTDCNGELVSNYWEDPDHGSIISVTLGDGGDVGEIWFHGDREIEINDEGEAMAMLCANPDNPESFGEYIDDRTDENLHEGIWFTFKIMRGMTEDDLLE